MKKFLIPGLIVGAAVLVPKIVRSNTNSFNNNTSTESRGFRNNNPGNIKINSANNWLGKSLPNTDGTFEQFNTYVYGLRALTKLLINYINQGHDSLRLIANRYAPHSENNTESYLQFLSDSTGIGKDVKLNLYTGNFSIMYKIVKAVERIENGSNKINQNLFHQAWQLI